MLVWLSVGAGAGTIDVGSGYSHTTVAAGVAAASDGDTIAIHAGQGPEAKGAYLETVEIDDARTLTIAGVGMPLLRSGDPTDGFFAISGAGAVTLRGLAFDGGGANRAARLSGAATVIIEDCAFDDTASLGGGGALNVDDTVDLTIARTTFANSTSQGVGGFIQIGSNLGPELALRVEDSSFSGGQTVGNNDGGAVYCNAAGGCTFERTTFAGNTAGSDGGAIAGEAQAPLTITDSRFCNNTAAGRGGAVEAYNSPAITGSLFVANDAMGNGGGAAWFDGAVMTLSHNDFIANTTSGAGTGPAVLLRDGALIATDNLFIDHGAKMASIDAPKPAAIDTLSHNLFFANLGAAGSAGYGDNAVVADPQLVDALDCETSSYERTPGSPALGQASDGGDIGAFGQACLAEQIADGIDQDCDGGDLCFADGDGDGFGEPDTTVESLDLDCADAGEADNDDDICPEFDDRIDADNDGIPDGCDPTPDGTLTQTDPTDVGTTDTGSTGTRPTETGTTSTGTTNTGTTDAGATDTPSNTDGTTTDGPAPTVDGTNEPDATTSDGDKDAANSRGGQANDLGYGGTGGCSCQQGRAGTGALSWFGALAGVGGAIVLGRRSPRSPARRRKRWGWGGCRTGASSGGVAVVALW